MSEAARLRLQHIEFERGFIVVREAKGMKSRQTLLPKSLLERLDRQIGFVQVQHAADLVDAGNDPAWILAQRTD